MAHNARDLERVRDRIRLLEDQIEPLTDAQNMLLAAYLAERTRLSGITYSSCLLP